MKYYYDIEDDLNQYPDCWCYLIIGGRNTGKTYSTLVYEQTHGNRFIFIKRTNLDVNNLCAGGHVHNRALDMDFKFDLSPYADINQDKGWNIKASKIYDGLGAFFEYDMDDNLLSGEPQSYIFSLNRVAKFKGFGGLRNCVHVVFDEFIASPWERVSREEGNQLMDLYKTVSRDREHRGQPALKLIGLANANDISNPIFNTLQITDEIANMISEGKEFLVTRGILVHLLKDSPEFYEKESQTQVYQAMHDTVWGRMAFDNEFSRNDFSCIRKYISIKKAVPVCTILFEGSGIYIYKRDETYLITSVKHKSNIIYDFSIEADRKRFFFNELIYIKNATTEGRALYNNYRMYDIIYHFNDNFKV